MQRRSLIAGLAGMFAAGAAPAIIIPKTPGILMPIKRVWQPPRFIFRTHPSNDPSRYGVMPGDVMYVGFNGVVQEHWIRDAGTVVGVNFTLDGRQQLVYAP